MSTSLSALTEQLAKDVARLTRERDALIAAIKQIHEACKRGADTQDHGWKGNVACIIDHITPDPEPLTEAAAVAFVRCAIENNSPTNIRSPFNACMYQAYCKTLADIPDGCEVVPVVPTVRMVEAAEALGDGAEPRAIYTAMIAALVKP